MTPRERFLAACRKADVDRPPAWMMRQAGRYLPEYRAMRAGKSFLDMVHDPAIAAELTLQPIRRFGMDAAVVFCDILVPPAAMGVGVEFVSGRGPVLTPAVRTAADFDALHDFEATEATGFLAETLRLVRTELGDERALIGFCGAPFTVASYMIEGQSSRNFEHTKAMMLGEPELFDRLLDRVVDVSIPYLAMQTQAGADVLQIFDSWGGALDAETYRTRILPGLTRLVAGAKATGVPVIVYANGGGHLLELLASTGTDVVSIDWRVDPRDAIARIGGKVALQGNLDPCTLFAPPEVVEREARKVLTGFEGPAGYIFNLGSGILPKTPLDSVEALWRTVLGRELDTIPS
ncbi:MAG: uroporphyrinogen decarboxylase [bacterium]|nr:uroporphyrinogen decarboxylase [bacterium]